MEYLNAEGTIWVSDDGNVFAEEGSGSVNQTISGNLHVKQEVDDLEVNGDVIGNVHVSGEARVEINGSVKGNVHAENGTETIIEGSVLESVFGASNVIVREEISGKTYNN